MIGRTLSHYRIVAPLGSGGMGTVYRAEDTLLGRPVALKFPRRDVVDDPEVRARFLREARIASALDHPNIVVLYDVCEVEGEVFLAMQCVEGRSLRRRMDEGALPYAETLAVGRAVADALAHAHGRGVVHRDIKPENILIAQDGRVKVADFGIALLPGETRITRTGGAPGTWSYLAPEVLKDGPAEARSDVYSLGVVLYELCAGVPAFAGDQPAAILYRVVHEEPPALPPSCDVPEELKRLLRSMLAKDPGARPAGAVEVANALARLAEASPASAATASAAPPGRSIAVLDFENLTRDPEDDYFCSGITEDVATDLLKIPDLQVVPRGAAQVLRGRSLDPKQIGRELATATVLQGSVRRAGGRIRVSAQLVRTDSGYSLWAERYDRAPEDIFEVQDDISRQIASALRLVFQPEDADARLGRRTKIPRAYDLRLRALALYNRMDVAHMLEAIGVLEEALREDPDYALGHADLAECCVQMRCKDWDPDPRWLDRAEVEAHRALGLAPSLPEGFRALGHLYMHRNKPHLALREFHHAAELDPRFPDALMKLGNAYQFVGDASRAEVYARRAIGITPDNSRYHGSLASVLLRQRRMVECRAAARRALELDAAPVTLQIALRDIVLSHAWEADFAGARRVAEEARQRLGEGNPFAHSLEAMVAAFEGNTHEARRLLAGGTTSPTRDSDRLINVARTHVLLGEREAAIAALKRAPQIIDLDELRADPQLSTLRGDPWVEKLIEPLAS